MEVSQLRTAEKNRTVDEILDRYPPPLTQRQLKKLFKEMTELREDIAEKKYAKG